MLEQMNKRVMVEPAEVSTKRMRMTQIMDDLKMPKTGELTDHLPVTEDDTTGPTDFLRSLLSPSSTLANSDKSIYEGNFFIKPSEQDLAAYDSTAIKAIRHSDIELLRQFHTEGRSLNACNRFGESLLHMACRRGDIEVVKFLVEEARVRVNVRDDFGRTPYHDACWTPRPNVGVMDVLIRAAECPTMLLVEDVRGHTSFDYARREHRAPWVSFLRERQHVLQQAQVVKVVA